MSLHELEVEAVLHILDGAPQSMVMRRYGLAQPTLSGLTSGRLRPSVRNEAIEIYAAYRANQLAEKS